MPDARREGMTAEEAELGQLYADRTRLSAEVMVLANELAESQRDVRAYREALGYGIAGEYPARLSDGTLPINAEADAFRREMHKAKDALAASQQEVERLKGKLEIADTFADAQLTDIGRLRAQLAAAREDSARLREQVRLANIDAANNEAEANDCRAALAVAQKDTERLDWLSTHEAAYALDIDGRAWVFKENTEDKDFDGATLREAIDAARSTDAERTHG